MNDAERLTAFTKGYSAEELYAKGYADGYENGRMSKEPVFFPPCEDCNKMMNEVRKAYDYWKAQKSDTISEFEKIKEEIKEWYWQADKQKISEDPCVVDAMIDLFIRTVDKHISEMKGKNE